MKSGDRVTGVPSNERLRRTYPTVTGTYSADTVKKPWGEFSVEYVKIGDGTYVDCINIEPANRRHVDTADLSEDKS